MFRLQLRRRARSDAPYLVLAFDFVIEALFGEAEALVVVVFTAKTGQYLADFPQGGPADVHFIDAFDVIEGRGEFRGDDDAELFGYLGAIADGIEFGEVFEPGVKAIATVFVVEPFLVPAAAPFVEITFVDGAAAEFLGEHLAALGQFVDPLKNFRAGLAVHKAAVELFADVVWQAGYFSYAAHVDSFLFSSCVREWHMGWDKGCPRVGESSKIQVPEKPPNVNQDSHVFILWGC
jgi:hypothetical protein